MGAVPETSIKSTTSMTTASMATAIEEPAISPGEAAALVVRRAAIAEANQRNSPLLRLPGEIRNRIYEYALSDRFITAPTVLERLSMEHFDANAIPTHNLSLTCRQLYNETHPLVYRYGIFYMPDVDAFLRNMYMLDPDDVPAVNCSGLDAHEFNALLADQEDFRQSIETICVECIDLDAHSVSTNFTDRLQDQWFDYPEVGQRPEFIFKLDMLAFKSGEDFEEVFGRLEALKKVVVRSTKSARESDEFRAFNEGDGAVYGVDFNDWNRWAVQKWTGKKDIEIVYE